MKDLAYLSAVDIATAIRERSISAREVLALYLQRIERFDPQINAIVALQAEQAQERATAADEALADGEIWGPLHGVPTTVKEAFDLVGTPTTWGRTEWRDNRPSRNAVAVHRLINAGAVVFGKTNVPTGLVDWQTFNEIYGTTNNPWDVARGPGGSSGGSAAALAAGLTGLELGSDIGASIRNPSHYCGVYGHKPTWEIIPTIGQRPPGRNASADIAVVGPMGRSAEDLAVAMGVLAGPAPHDAVAWSLELPKPRWDRLRDFRVGVMYDHACCAVDRSITDRIAAVVAALGKVGARVQEGAAPDVDLAHSHARYVQLFRAVTHAGGPQAGYDAAKAEVPNLAPDDHSYRAGVLRATVQDYRQWAEAVEDRALIQRAWEAWFKDFDVLICPAAATPAFRHDQEKPREERTITVNGKAEDYNDQLFWAGIAGLPYLPATVAPIGQAAGGSDYAGLPVGLQIIGPRLEDYTPIAFAQLLAEEIGGFVPPKGYE
ncbi:MAG: amidase [Sneathiellaceae bacterium]